jgi:hypothetical protein
MTSPKVPSMSRRPPGFDSVTRPTEVEPEAPSLEESAPPIIEAAGPASAQPAGPASAQPEHAVVSEARVIPINATVDVTSPGMPGSQPAKPVVTKQVNSKSSASKGRMPKIKSGTVDDNSLSDAEAGADANQDADENTTRLSVLVNETVRLALEDEWHERRRAGIKCKLSDVVRDVLEPWAAKRSAKSTR